MSFQGKARKMHCRCKISTHPASNTSCQGYRLEWNFRALAL